MMAFMAKWFKAGKSGTYDTRGAQSGVILPVPDRRVYRITSSQGKCSEEVFNAVCSELDIPPCLRPFFALCPEKDPSRCVHPYHELDFPGLYCLRVFTFLKSTHHYFRKLASKTSAMNCYFQQVRRDFLQGLLCGMDGSENFKETFKMAALDAWRVALEERQGQHVDILTFLKGHSVEEFLPTNVITAVKSPTKWLEYVCKQIPDKIFGGVERGTREKCIQCYVKTYEEMASPDVYSFTVNVDRQDAMEIEISAYHGIKCKTNEEQSTLCQIYDVLHIDTLASHNLAKVVYRDPDLRNTFLQLIFITNEDLVTFCFLMNTLYQLVVDANKILVEGSLKPPEMNLKMSPNDPLMSSICHRQICRDRAIEVLQKCPSGSYLVRESRSDHPSLVLNVVVSGEVKSFKIEYTQEKDRFCIFDMEPFPCLSDLLQSCERGNIVNLPVVPSTNYSPKALAQEGICIPIISNWTFLVPTPSISDGSISSMFYDQFSPSAQDIPPLVSIAPETLTKVKLIGEGNFSKVYQGFWESKDGTNVEVAIKVLKDKKAWQDMKAEAERMHQLKHDNIVSILGYSITKMENECMVITEYVAGGDLKSYMRRCLREGRPLDNVTQMRFASQVAFGMAHLTENNMVHRDLAARNVLVSSNHVVKITDFGLSRKFAEGKLYYRMRTNGSQTALPLYWYAPECLVEFKFSKYSDVWSFGILLFELFSHGDEPYAHYICPPTFEGIRRALTIENQRLPKPSGCPQNVYEDIMLKCWYTDPSQRPDFMTLAINLTDMSLHVYT